MLAGKGLWPIKTLVAAVCLAGNLAVAEEHQASEFEMALMLPPNVENGARLYRACVSCHGAEGWGTVNGAYPQIAGQHASVTIKQLADIRAGNRDNPIMRAFTSTRALGSAQDIADVAAYIAALPMTRNNGKSSTGDLEHGKQVYEENCVDCHGANGEGNAADYGPLIQGQHYHYLVRQFNWIRNGRRRNADEEMVAQIQRFSAKDITSVMAYTASLQPPEEKLAQSDWTNPDFPNHWRGWRPTENVR